MTTIAQIMQGGDAKRILDKFIAVEHVRLSKFREAGLIESNADLNARAAGAGQVTSIPFYNPLDGDSEVGSDDLSVHITPGNLTGDELLAVRQHRNKAWAGAALAKMVSGLDISAAIGTGIAKWRALDEQKVALAMLNGVLADAIANAGDTPYMVAGSDTAKLDPSMLADAAQTKGERKDVLDTLLVHSAVEARLIKDNQVTTIPANEQRGAFNTYQGKRLIVSDALPVASGVYTSILCAPGVISYGEAEPEFGSLDYVRSATAGNGSGGETIIARRNYIMAVQGYSYTGAANPNNTALASASNYVRKFDPALIPLVFIKSDLT